MKDHVTQMDFFQLFFLLLENQPCDRESHNNFSSQWYYQ